MKLVGQCTSSFSSFFKWSPDGKYFLTAIVYEKLKEDHRFTVFGANGTELKKVICEVSDLINVDFAYRPLGISKQEYPEIPYQLPNPGLL